METGIYLLANILAKLGVRFILLSPSPSHTIGTVLVLMTLALITLLHLAGSLVTRMGMFIYIVNLLLLAFVWISFVRS